MSARLFFLFLALLPLSAQGQDAAFQPNRCELIPLPDHQVSFRIDGVEKTRWHYDAKYPRPFFYPFNGPSGVSLTRMGHPGAQNHDHHRSVWFAHAKIEGHDFWSDQAKACISQRHWYRYRDGDKEAVMATLADWKDGEGNLLLEQDIVAALIPLEDDERALELHLTFRCPKGRESVELNQTNFGFLAVRVSKTLSAYFGGGIISNSEGQVGEKEIFGKPARWMDYSGPVVVGEGPGRKFVTEGITYFDHPDNLRYPSHWHVRQDGWMGSGFCLKEPYTVKAGKPLVLRYLLHAHSGQYDHKKAETVSKAFAKRPGFEIGKPNKPHRQYEVWRTGTRPE